MAVPQGTVHVNAQVRKVGCLKNELVTEFEILATRIYISSLSQIKISFAMTDTVLDPTFLVSL